LVLLRLRSCGGRSATLGSTLGGAALVAKSQDRAAAALGDATAATRP
jgi:hypothetical protein